MRSRLRGGVMVLLMLVAFGGTARAGEFKANVQFGGSVMVLNVPVKRILSSNLVVSGPEGYRMERSFGRSTVISVNLGMAGDGQGQVMELLGGAYKWELRVYTGTVLEASAAESVPENPAEPGGGRLGPEQWLATGRFRVEGGSIVGLPSEEKAKDQRGGGAVQGVTRQGGSPVVPMDVIGENLYVVGGVCSGCYNLDPNLYTGELLVQDVVPYITMRDTDSDQRWRWYSTNGPLHLESARLNQTSIVSPLIIENHAPSNTLYLDNAGVVGIGTSTPSTLYNVSGLDIVRPDFAALRLKSTNPGAHTWALYASSGVSALFDETSGTVPFKVFNGAPSDTLQIQGSGTGIVSVKGALIISSSREYKDNIRDLTVEEATSALHELNPVAFVYKAGGGEQHIGFIAEEVPELVATKDRKGLSPMDIVAVLTKVVQEKSQRVERQQNTIERLERALEAMEKRLSSLEKQ